MDVLTGKSTDKTRRMGHDTLAVFGVGKDIPPKTWQSVYRQLLALGLVRVDHGAYGALKLDGEFRAVFRGERQVQFRKDRAAKGKASRGQKPSAASTALSEDEAVLFGALRAERSAISRAQGVPPYVVFNDATLVALAQERPQSLEAFAVIPGVGQAKLDKYGERFVALISRHADVQESHAEAPGAA